jgi:hypothetical protein
MIVEYRRKANLGVVLYFVFKIAAIGWAMAAGQDSPLNTSIFWLLFLLGTSFAIRACWAQAVAKGHSGSFAMAGLLGFWGFVIAAMLSDRMKEAAAIA